MYDFKLTHGIGLGERNDRHDLAGFGASLERATGLDPWLPHAWPMAAFPEAHTSDGYMPGFGGAVRGFQILAGLDPDGVARSGGPTEKALAATLDPARRGRTVTADEVYRGAPPGTVSIASGHPADGGAKAAAKIRKLSQRTAGPGATGAGKSGSGANRRPPVPTVPPPGVRQSVGAGGVNDHGDLLQARRNLARVGYAPRIAGIGEPDGGLAAVQNGLRAYQQARGLKVDGLMNPGGATERALHTQIGRQQKRLIEQVAKDAAEAAAKLSAGGWSGNAGAIGGPESVAARTLGARMTGAKVEAQQRQAYAETLDRMKRAGAQATKDGTGAKRPQGVAGHPLARAAAARNARAERRKQAGLGDIEHAAQRASATQEFAPDAARLNDPAGRREAVRRGFGLARKRGVLPDQLAGWLQRQLREPGDDFAPNDPHGRRLHYTAGPAVEAAREVNRLRRDRPGLWAGLPAAVRRKAAAIGAAQAGMETSDSGADGDGGGRERAILLRADDLLRSVAAQGNRETAARIARAGFDLLTDLAPVVGDIKAAAEARDLLRQAEAAERSSQAGRAAELRALAGLSLASIIPLARAARAGKKLIDRIAGLSRRLKGGADPIVDAIDARAAAANRKGGRSDASRSDTVPKDAILRLERWGLGIPGFDKAVSQRMLARMMEADRKVGKNPTFDDIFREIVQDLPEETQERMRASFSGYLGAAGEHNLVFLLGKAGAEGVEHTGRMFDAEGTRFAFDVLTDSALNVRKGPLGKRAVPAGKESGMKTGLDSKLGPESGPSKNQRKGHAYINSEKTVQSVRRNDPVEADTAIFLKQDFRELHLPALQRAFRVKLGRQKLLNEAQMEQVMKNLAAYHRLSKSGYRVTTGQVFAFTIISVALMKAAEDGI